MTAEALPRRMVSPKDWIEGWWQKSPNPTFHRLVYSPLLVENYDKLFEEGKTGRVFIPLCGKTLDLIYFADKGHDVVGLEFSELAVTSFFKENNLTFTESTISDFVVYKCKEKNIIIYRGDLFKMKADLCGQFDAFYDRGSYVAVNLPMQEAYADLIFTLMKPDSKILMEAISYDLSRHTGPPQSVSAENVRNNFGRKCVVEVLSTTVYPAPAHYTNPGADLTLNLCRITLKK